MTETETNTYDVVVLGAGPVGENVADRTRAAGLTTAVVESELVGGECSYWACMPSKALLRPVIARADARRLPGLRQSVQGPLDTEAVLARRNWFTGDWTDDGQVDWLKSIGADLHRGHGRLSGPRTVTVGDTVLTARHAVVVATGTRAALPDLPGLAEVRPWTSREATSAQSAPGRLVVVGGGVVATEMATAWQALGSQVTLLVRGKGLLDRMEPFAGELVAEALTEAGADVRTGTSVTSVTRSDGIVVVVTDTGERIEADEILFAVGRAPRTDDIGLETVGLAPGSSLTVDDSLRVTGTDWLYGVGDVNHRALLTHQGKYQARIAGAAIAARAAGTPSRRPTRGATTPRRPTTSASPRSSSPTRRRPPSGSRSPRRKRPDTGCAPSTSTCPRWPERACTPRATRGAPGWSSTWSRRSCAGSPSSAPASES